MFILSIINSFVAVAAIVSVMVAGLGLAACGFRLIFGYWPGKED